MKYWLWVVVGVALAVPVWGLASAWLARRRWAKVVHRWRMKADEAMNGAYRRERARKQAEEK